MYLTVNETSKLTGVSIRTLHYYDEIGLFKPDYVNSENNYRYYSEQSLAGLQEILFYRELDFSLKEIQSIISNPDYQKNEVLEKQKHLLLLKKERIDRLIKILDNTLKGENEMANFKAFDNSEYEAQKAKYAEEVKSRWGNTKEYKESQKKGFSPETNEQADIILKEFGDCLSNGAKPSDDNVQALVEKWQNYITKYFYSCSKEILASLGLMYVADERFKENIDRFGDGNADFMNNAIQIYCNK